MASDQIKRQNEWISSHLAAISVRYKPELVTAFRDACKKLGVSQSEVIRDAMETTIRKAEGK